MMARMKRMVSEPILPEAGTFDAGAMAGGTPGLPTSFRWRGVERRIDECESAWKSLRPEPTGGELYLRRHYYALRMDDGTRWVVYCLRQPSSMGGGRQRWFLFTVEGAGDRPEEAK
jgi:hypothetical protein